VPETLSPPSRTPAGANALAERIVDATLACVARYGLAKTTVDDVAREAGLSRATLYRVFPGKQPLLEAVVARELERLAAVLRDAAEAADSLDDTLVAVIVAGARHLESHAALATVLAHEGEALLPYLTFDGAGRTLGCAGELLAPLLAPYVGDDRAVRAGEWVARIALAYLCAPSAAVRLTDPVSVRELVTDFVVPSLVRTTPASKGWSS
jgi:AcrR family transcriptional regulator